MYSGFGVGELRRMKQIEDGNRKLKQLVADLTLDKHILHESRPHTALCCLTTDEYAATAAKIAAERTPDTHRPPG